MCVFCDILKDKKILIHESEYLFSIYDKYPVSEGHVLIIPKRHIKDYFELNNIEKRHLDIEISEVKKILDVAFHPDGYNIGINNGLAAGQTIFHLHIHLIPRYTGDVDDPRGGVRGVIPSKQKY